MRENLSRKTLMNLRYGREGFTLIEVIIVIGILSIALLMIARIFPLGMRAKESAERCSVAAVLGQRLMEEIKRKGYDALKTAYSSESPHYGVGEGSFRMHRGFRWQVEWWDTKVPNLRKVRVRIFYGEPRLTDGGTYQPHLDLITYLAKRN